LESKRATSELVRRKIKVGGIQIIYNSETEYLNFLKSLNSYKSFNLNFLPSGITIINIKNIFDFISPAIIILHGSCVTGKRRSPSSEKDIDLILINDKFAFWNYEEILNKIDSKSAEIEIEYKFDVSITTCQGFFNHLKHKTSLGASIDLGFSIIPLEEYSCKLMS